MRADSNVLDRAIAWVFAVSNVVGAGAWGLIGLVVLGLTGMSVRASDAYIPMVLLGGSFLLYNSGRLVLRPTPQGHASGWTILTLCLAVACGLSYVALCYARKMGDFQTLDSGTVGLILFPGVIALFALGEVVFLCVMRMVSWLSESRVAPDRRPDSRYRVS